MGRSYLENEDPNLSIQQLEEVIQQREVAKKKKEAMTIKFIEPIEHSLEDMMQIMSLGKKKIVRKR
jgi:hypothetical protein